MTKYILIDTDTDEIIATGDTKAEVLGATPYQPSDCDPDATTWQDVVDAAESHEDGLLGLVEGYLVRRVCAHVATSGTAIWGVGETAEEAVVDAVEGAKATGATTSEADYVVMPATEELADLVEERGDVVWTTRDGIADVAEAVGSTGSKRDGSVAAGSLHDYATGEYIRPASDAELRASQSAAKSDGGSGVIEVDGRSVYAPGDGREDLRAAALDGGAGVIEVEGRSCYALETETISS